MNPILYDISEKNFTSHGLGVLECMSCFVEEERNGSYELEMKAALKGSHVADLSVGRIILAKPNRTDRPQPFRIYNVVKSLDQTIQAYARHISYDLSGRILSSISKSSCGATLSALASDPALNSEWTFTTDRSAISGDFSSEVPGSCRSWLGGRKGSVLDLYGPADWHFDRFTCEFLTSRGADRGVTIRYGKNLLAMKAAVDSSNVYSGVLCYYDSDGVVVKGTEVATGQTALQRTLLIDKTGDYTDAVPTATQLTDDATAYVSSHNLTAPASNITLDWVQSGEIIDRIDLCDTVSVIYEDFGVSAKAKCIRTKWNVLEERYEEIEIGEVKTTLADTIASTPAQIQQSAQEVTSAYMAAIKAASALITGAAGGYVVLWNSTIMAPADETHPANEILVMDAPDISTAVKIWRWNINGLGYSNNGYAGPFQTAFTMNGEIATWFIDTVRLNADNITTGYLSADRIEAASIALSKLATAVQNSINDATKDAQLIYKSAPAGTSSMSGTTTWITSTSDSQGAWRRKRPTYKASYPVLFVATQRKAEDGTVTCTTPVKDDTTTVIDGGHITTGTIDASVVNVTNINADNINAGTISGININGTVITNSDGSNQLQMTGATLVSENASGDKIIYGPQGAVMLPSGATLPLGTIGMGGTNDTVSIYSSKKISLNAAQGIFLNGHESAVGTIVDQSLSADFTLAAATPTTLLSVQLTPGVWILFAHVNFVEISGNSSNMRMILNVSDSSSATTSGRIRNDFYAPANVQYSTMVCGYMVVSTTKYYYLYVYASLSRKVNKTNTRLGALRIV